MSSLFNQASLVVEPAVYENGKVYATKPFDGTGDLTFTRASSATRVASNGLIEKVRTNVILQSNTFSNASWGSTDLTATSGATDPNGGTTAWTIANTAASGIIQQAVTLTGLRTFSIYAKQGTHRYLYMGAYGGTISYATFDLQTGTIAAGSNARIESIGNGWYRCTCHSADGTTGGVQIFPTDTISSGATTNGNILVWNCQYETGDIATDYIATTTTAVSVGPVSGLPRLDYLNSSCPRLLLEPSSTTLLPFSEQLDNAAWDKTSGGAAITANSVTSPDGYTNADTITGTGASVAFVLVRQNLTVAGAGTYTFSGFFKYNNHPFVSLNLSAYDGGGNANYNIQTGVVTNVSAGSTAKIENYGNGWYRCSLTSAIGASDLTGRPSIYVAYDGTTSDFPSTAEATGKAVYAWGFNMCLGSYVQSYLPTLSTSVTRVADDMDTTFASALATSGSATWFLEFDGNTIPQVNQTGGNFSLNFASGDFLAYNHNANPEHRFRVQADASYFAAASGLNANSPAKLAVSVTASSYVAYANGVQIGTSSIVGNWASAINFSTTINDTFGSLGIKQMLFFPTALTATQLEELTA
jgi:hypothetical protein